MRPLDKISLKNGFLVEKGHFSEIFPGHFFQKYDLRAGGGKPQNRREGRKIAVTPLITLLFVFLNEPLFQLLLQVHWQ